MASESIDPPDAGGQARVPPTPAQRHVAELAEEGRRQQAAARAAEEAESRRTERRERREVERLGRANVRAALLESPREASPPLLATAIGGVVAGTVLLMAAEGFWSTAGLALILLASFGFFAARWVVGIRLVGAERAWLRSLPFPVRGYFRVLGDTPSEERQVRLRIRFRGVAPEREVLEGILGRVHLPATARPAAARDRRGRWRAGRSAP